MKNTLLILLSLTSFYMASFIYVVLRPISSLIYSVVTFFDIHDLLIHFRLTYAYFTNFTPSWVIYHVPNGLWAFSYIIGIYILFGELNKKSILLMLIAPCSGIGEEVLQMLNIAPGKGDWPDILSYLVASLIASVIIYLANKS